VLAAFLGQQYVRSLAFSRGRPAVTAVQSGLVLAAATVLLTLGQILYPPMSANMILTLMGIAYGAVVVGGYVTATHSSAALAALAATQLLLRPIPLLAASWSMVAHSDLVRRREARDWSGFSLLIAITLAGGAAIAALWTGIIFWAWRPLAGMVFHGKFSADGWMLLLWGLSALISFCQIAIGIGLQVLRAFKVLALANTLASLAAVAAILIAMGLYGTGGAILGTVIGQGLELIVMSALLITGVRAAARQAKA